MIAFLNGRWIPENQARVSVLDHGYLYGDGLFETMRAYQGRILFVRRHLARLRSGLSRLKIRSPYTQKDFADHLNRALLRNRLKNAYVRLSISRGAGEIGLDPALCKSPTVLILVRPFSGYPEAIYRSGYAAVISAGRRADARDPVSALKTTNYAGAILGKIEAKAKRVHETLFRNTQGYLTEGTVSNLFIVRKKIILTPPISAGILPGITRAAVLQLARQLSIRAVEASLTERDLFEAEEAFVTNTSLEIMPLVRVNRRLIGTGRPGPVTIRLREGFRRMVSKQIGDRTKGGATASRP